MPTDIQQLEQRLWQAADNLRANSTLSSYEYSMPVLGLIFLRYAWHRFQPLHEQLKEQSTGRRTIGPDDYKSRNVLYLPREARYDFLLQLPESEDIGRKVNEAMEAVEQENKELAGVLPKQYDRTLFTQTCNEVFDHIYQSYFKKQKISVKELHPTM